MQNTPTSDFKDLSLSDLVDQAKFELWIRKHINIYSEKEIPANHLISFTEYIEKKVQEPDFPYDRNNWLNTLNKLKEAIPKNDSFRERHKKDTEEVP